MQIYETVATYGNDFFATYECEHCWHITTSKAGYSDDRFYLKVIPAMYCPRCEKNRAGTLNPNGEKVLENKNT